MHLVVATPQAMMRSTYDTGLKVRMIPLILKVRTNTLGKYTVFCDFFIILTWNYNTQYWTWHVSIKHIETPF